DVEHPGHGRRPVSRIGVGLKPLHGLLICGQLEINSSTSRSTRSSTYLPGAETPSSKVRPPSGVSGTFMKKLMLWVRSRFSSPRPHSRVLRRNVVRQEG